MRFKVVYCIMFVALILLPNQVFAQTSQTFPSTAAAAVASPTNIIQRQTKQSTGQTGTELPSVGAKQQEDMVATIQQAQQQAIARFQTQKNQYKLRLQEIQNEQKKAIVERINSQIENANKTYGEKFASALNTLQSVIDELMQQVDALKTEGLNTKEADTALNRAQKAIDAAKTALINQAAKGYVIQLVTTEQGLKASVGKTVSQFRTDLSNTNKLMIDAKQSVQNVTSTLNRIKNSQNIVTPTAVK